MTNGRSKAKYSPGYAQNFDSSRTELVDEAMGSYVLSPKPVAGSIDESGRLSLCRTQWYIEGAPAGHQIVSCDQTAYIEYQSYGFNFKSRTVNFQGGGLGVFNFGNEVIAGNLICAIKNVKWHDPSDGKIKNSTDRILPFAIIGKNPSPALIRAELPDLDLKVIAYLESRFRQFGPDKLPLWGPSKSSSGGFGLMQLDTPRPNESQMFDWHQNVARGAKLVAEKIATVKRHFENERKSHPERRELTKDELRRALFTNYNSGGFYYCWDNVALGWAPNGDPTYADNAMRIAENVQAGKPPADWG